LIAEKNQAINFMLNFLLGFPIDPEEWNRNPSEMSTRLTFRQQYTSYVEALYLCVVKMILYC
jgi:hypothetical protein